MIRVVKHTLSGLGSSPGAFLTKLLQSAINLPLRQRLLRVNLDVYSFSTENTYRHIRLKQRTYHTLRNRINVLLILKRTSKHVTLTVAA